jgi:acetyl-CoA synthetase
MANLLKSRGIKRGDIVAIYMPVCPLTVVTMLACTRIGAAHSVVFAGFSAQALASRIKVVDVMITIFCDFRQPSTEKRSHFWKN